MKEVEENTDKWNDFPHSWIGRINIVKTFRLPKAIDRFSAILIKIPMSFFIEIKRITFIWNHKNVASAIMNKKNKVEALHYLILEYTVKL